MQRCQRSKAGDNSRTSVLSLSTSWMSIKRHCVSGLGWELTKSSGTGGRDNIVYIRVSQPWHQLTFQARSFFVGAAGAVMCPGGCSGGSVVSRHKMPVAHSPHSQA